MSNQATLEASKREGTGKGVARKLRQDGRIPAVLYGRDMETVHLSVDAHDAEHLFRSISVDNTIISLKVDGVKQPYETLVREIQTHPWRPMILHVDFLRIQAGVAVELDVPIHLVGIPAGVRLSGGVLEQTIHDLPIRCLPSQIPEQFELDVTEMELNDALHVSDLDLGEGVEVRIDPDQTICSVAVPRIIEEDEADEVEEPELVDGEAADEDEEGGEDSAEESDGDED